MRALTIHQPWASAIASGPKRVENRKKRPPQKAIGRRFAIHAGVATPKMQALLQVQGLWTGFPWPLLFPLGMVVAVARLEEVVPASEAFFIPQHRGWVTGPWCWILDDVEARVLGQLG